MMKKLATLHKNKIILNFRYDLNLINQVKKLSGRRWNSRNKYWTCHLCLENVETLLKLDFILSLDILKWKQALTSDSYSEDINIPGLKGKLRPFQKEGVSFIQAKKGRALIADEMGLGKTVQAIGYLQLRKRLRPALIVCPATAKGGWNKHVKEWMTGANKVYVLKGKPKAEDLPLMREADIVISNFDILVNDTEKKVDPKTKKIKRISIKNTGWEDFLSRNNFKAMVIDEIHYCKTAKALRTKAVKKIAKTIPKVIGLSGTPFENRPVELFVPLSIINPGVFPNYFHFTKRYCDAKHNGWGWDYTGASNKDELHLKLSNTVMLRRKKSEVLTELPPKVRSVIPIEIDRKKYEQAEEDFEEWLDDNYDNPAAAMVEMEKLKQAAVEAKLDSAIQWIWEYLESGNKLVVFAHHKEVVDRLEKRFAGMAVTISGKTSTNKRHEIEQQFQTDDKIRLFIGTEAAAEAITLTAANATCFIELWWKSGKHDQAEDRVHRMTQKADSVTAYYLLAEGTIEEDIALILDGKREVMDAVLDGKKTEETAMIVELLKKYKEAA